MGKLLTVSISIGMALAIGAASPALAAYTTVATSGTAAKPLQGILASGIADGQMYYVNPASGTASDKNASAIQLVTSGDWTFDFSDPTATAFTGNIFYGDYKTQVVLGTASVDSRQSYYGLNQFFSGIGYYNVYDRSFSYSIAYNGVAAYAGGASNATVSSPSICTNGGTSALLPVCSSLYSPTSAWEAIKVQLAFSADGASFSGTVTGYDRAKGLLGATNTIFSFWQISGVCDPVAGQCTPAPQPPVQTPIPAAGWSLGAALIGLAGAARRNNRKQRKLFCDDTVF